MRLQLAICARGAFVPFNYNQLVHGMIFEKLNLADADYAKKLHDDQSFKYFTFSELFIPKGKADRDKGGIEVFSDTMKVTISSPEKKFVRALTNGFLADPKIRLGSLALETESFNIADTPGFSSDSAIFKTISPIVATTKREIDGKTRTWDILHDDAQFYENVRKNLLRKYEMLYDKKPSEGKIEFKTEKFIRTRRIRIKDDYHVGNMLHFSMHAPAELLTFAYECGLGERNSMGFGMVEVE